jgi:hypothetical protein
MTNDPELDGKYLGTITQDFVKVAKILQEASYQIRIRKISNYPIFPITKKEVTIGQPLIEKKASNLDWNYYISYLEEFVHKKLVLKIEEFEIAYKDADEFCCLFVIDSEKEFHNFVFIPFPEDD